MIQFVKVCFEGIDGGDIDDALQTFEALIGGECQVLASTQKNDCIVDE